MMVLVKKIMFDGFGRKIMFSHFVLTISIKSKILSIYSINFLFHPQIAQ
jgi:hypothetical protein